MLTLECTLDIMIMDKCNVSNGKGFVLAMDENNKKTYQMGEENKKDNNPLSVRVDPYYKEVFEDLIKQKNIPKKTLLEAMISSYVDIGLEDERESNISFANEINLIAGNFNEIMSIFKTMTTKSQDTIGSQKSFFEQRIRNLETTIQMLENNNTALEEKNKLLELLNNSNKSDKEKLEKTIRDLNELDTSSEKEISVYIRKNAELLEQINILQKEEKVKVLLKAEIEKAKNEIKVLKSSLEDKSYENGKLSKKISDMEESIIEVKNKKADEFKELEFFIRKEADVDKKMEILKMQLQYNELQAESLKNLGIINKKSEEIAELKLKLEKA